MSRCEKFGQIVDLDELDTMAREARGGEELKIKLRAQETYHAKEAASGERSIQQSNDEYTALIEQHTLLFEKIAASKRERERKREEQLQENSKREVFKRENDEDYCKY